MDLLVLLPQVVLTPRVLIRCRPDKQRRSLLWYHLSKHEQPFAPYSRNVWVLLHVQGLFQSTIIRNTYVRATRSKQWQRRVCLSQTKDPNRETQTEGRSIFSCSGLSFAFASGSISDTDNFIHPCRSLTSMVFLNETSFKMTPPAFDSKARPGSVQGSSRVPVTRPRCCGSYSRGNFI